MSSQHPVDLLPEAILARGQAGLRTGRYVASGVICIVLLVVATTHSRLALERTRAELADATQQADLVLATEAKADEISRHIEQTREYIERYRRLALPLEMSAVTATVVNTMLPGMTLDRVDLDAGFRRAVRGARSRGPTGEAPPRVLFGEISGFAPHDRDIAEFVSRLSMTEPFRDVGLDYSRTRDVNGVNAREFRLSFRIDLDVSYEVTRVAGVDQEPRDD